MAMASAQRQSTPPSNQCSIAMATLLERTSEWARGQGPPPYPLAEGVQDQQVALAIEESADRDTTVTTSREAWSLNS